MFFDMNNFVEYPPARLSTKMSRFCVRQLAIGLHRPADKGGCACVAAHHRSNRQQGADVEREHGE